MNPDPLRAALRDVPDFPKAGILFRDITPILADPDLLALAIARMAARHRGQGVDKVAAVEARGFIFGVGVAQALQTGFVPIRKKGKLPFQTIDVSYQLEYGAAELALHVDAIQPGERVLVIDDLLATGGTAQAAVRLLRQLGGEVVGVDFLIELDALRGRDRLADVDVFTHIHC